MARAQRPPDDEPPRAVDPSLTEHTGGVVLTDAAGRVIHANAAFLEQTGRSAADVIGEDVGRLVGPGPRSFDPETGLPGADVLAERARPVLALARRMSRSVAVARVRVAVADGEAGSEARLQAVADVLQRSLRESDLVGRTSDGEFVLVLQEVQPDETLGRAAGRILESVLAAAGWEAGTERGAAHMGVALYPRDASGWDEILERAGAALSLATRTGLGYAFHEAELTTLSRERIELEAEFAEATDHSRLLLHYQPVVATSSGRMVGAEALARGTVMGVEALARWPHEERGVVPPSEFIPMAESTGRILALDRWAVATAVRQASVWWEQGWTGWVSVNLSTRSVRDPDFTVYLAGLLESRGVPPERLLLEITETTAMRDPEATLAVLRSLKDLGVGLALDDFGTGHSSLAYLKKLPVDFIKLDRSFVLDLGPDERDRWLVEAIVALAHRIGAQVVAEGVERAEDLEWLRAAGCDLAQGYLLGRPGPADEFDPGPDVSI